MPPHNRVELWILVLLGLVRQPFSTFPTAFPLPNQSGFLEKPVAQCVQGSLILLAPVPATVTASPKPEPYSVSQGFPLSTPAYSVSFFCWSAAAVFFPTSQPLPASPDCCCLGPPCLRAVLSLLKMQPPVLARWLSGYLLPSLII